jgi:hypothetical protein
VAHESKREWGGARVLNFLIIFGGGGFSPAKQKKRRTNAKFRWREVGQRKLYDIFGGHWLAGEHNTVFLAAKKTVEHNVSFGGHSQNQQN